MADLLADLLADSRVAAARGLREKHAGRARAAQARHARYSRLFLVATALAALAGALILYGAGADATLAAGGAAAIEAAGSASPAGAAEATPPTSERLATFLSGSGVRTGLFVVQVAALALAAFAAEMLRETRASDEWLNERRAAEAGRIAVFDTLWSVASAKGLDAQNAAFEHFVNEQLGRQIAFHEAAESRHAASAGRSAVVGAALAALIAATGAVGMGGAWWVAFAALVGVLAPVFLNALRGWRESTLDREKSERYRKAWAELTHLSGLTGEARAALAAGDPTKASKLIADVHEVMRAENEGWTPTAVKS